MSLILEWETSPWYVIISPCSVFLEDNYYVLRSIVPRLLYFRNNYVFIIRLFILFILHNYRHVTCFDISAYTTHLIERIKWDKEEKLINFCLCRLMFCFIDCRELQCFLFVVTKNLCLQTNIIKKTGLKKEDRTEQPLVNK